MAIGDTVWFAAADRVDAVWHLSVHACKQVVAFPVLFLGAPLAVGVRSVSPFRTQLRCHTSGTPPGLGRTYTPSKLHVTFPAESCNSCCPNATHVW
jgi:hypothetical protein